MENVDLESDQPFLRVLLSDTAELKCCYKGKKQELTWVKRTSNSSLIHKVNISDSEHEVKPDHGNHDGRHCSTLTFKNVQLNDTGLYQCQLGSSKFTHGTYLQVYSEYARGVGWRAFVLQADQECQFACVCMESSSCKNCLRLISHKSC